MQNNMRKTILTITSAAVLTAIAAGNVRADDQKVDTDKQPVHVQKSGPSDVGTPASAETGRDTATRKDADNSERNKQDHNSSTLTPGDQGNSKEDIETTRKIRKAVVADSSLSTMAKNVKIISRNGTVTLRGPVKTEAEKDAVTAKVKEVLGSQSFDNQIEVKADRTQ